MPSRLSRSLIALSSVLFVPALLCAAAPAPATAPEPLNLYVSPDGSDAFTGKLARNNHGITDGPFATIAHARDMVRKLKRLGGGKLTRPINIILRGGTYWLNQPLAFSADDSGTAEFPITYCAYPNEKPVISAGLRIRGWGNADLNGHQVWAANVRPFKDRDDVFGEMWVDGHRRFMARAPKKNFFLAGAVPELSDQTELLKGQSAFHYKDADLHNWPDIADADVVLMSLWAESHLPVAGVDEKERLVRFTKPTVLKMAPDDRYFIEGASELLDEPGEWCFVRKTATLYYYPLKGESMLGSEAVIPWREQIVRLEGRPEQGRFIEYLTFKDITFANSEWRLPRDPRAAGFNQAAWGVPGAVWGEGVRNCVMQDCTIAHAGNYGIELGRGCQHNRISYCTLTDLGAGGIKLGETQIHLAEAEQAGSNEVSDCTIANCGRIFPSAIGIWLGQTGRNLISHDDIHGLWYTGISVGWTWGYDTTLARDNIIEFNHVHHIGTPADGVEPVLSDMGAIYSLGVQPGTVVRGNHFHDIAGLRYGGWGIYFDEGSSHILAENNLVYRTTHGGFHQHYGADNMVRNNIFAFGRDAQIQRTRVENHSPFTFEKNIVYWDSGVLLTGDWSKLNMKFDYNTYWYTGGSKRDFAGRSWEQWRQQGMDLHSKIADPGFVDPQGADFHIKPGAEKELAGFVPFDATSAGPRPRKARI